MTVFFNARIISPEAEYNWMVVNKEGKIEAIGNGKRPEGGNEIDLQKRLVLPGMIDSHIHIYSLGRSKQRLNLTSVSSIEEMKVLLKQYAEKNTDDDWIVGFGWNQEQMVEGRYPSRDDIDQVIGDRPVVLIRACHHIGLVNSKALEILDISEDTPEPEGGRIDKKEGRVTGILRENALSLVTPHIEGNVKRETRQRYIMQGIKECVRLGITSVQTNDPKAIEIYKELDRKKQLPIRVFLTVPFKEVKTKELEPLKVSTHLWIERVKIFADGSLGASTAALRAPYSDQEDNKGILTYSDEEFRDILNYCKNKGWRIEVHAIGDAASEQAIQKFKELKLNRPVLTHAQVMSRDLIEQLEGEDIVVNIQPPFLRTDRHFAESRLGKRIEYSYAWRKMWDKRIKLAGGSDAPIEDPNPLLGINCLVFRRAASGESPWYIEEAISFRDALKIYTMGGAYAAGAEGILGKLEVGYFADFIVLDTDVDRDHSKLLQAEVQEVYIGGNRVY